MNEAVVGAGESVAGEPASRPILLKEVREASGLHIAALAAALKVPVKKLEALEAGRYSELPDMTFARALASSACRQLKVDPTPILRQIPVGSSPKLGDRGPSLNAPYNAGYDGGSANPLSWLSRPALLAAIALLLGALVIVFLPKAEAPPVASAAVESPAPAPAAEATAAQDPSVVPAPGGESMSSPSAPLVDPVVTAPSAAPAPQQTLSAPLPAVAAVEAPVSSSLLSIVATGESWVEVVNGTGNVVTQRLLQAGDVIDFSAAPPYTVVLGKADAAQVSVRGKPFDVAPFVRSNVARFEVK